MGIQFFPLRFLYEQVKVVELLKSFSNAGFTEVETELTNGTLCRLLIRSSISPSDRFQLRIFLIKGAYIISSANK